MVTKKFDRVSLLVALVVAMVIGSLGGAIALSLSVDEIGKTGAQLNQVVQHLDSVDSLKTILVTYGSQYQLAEAYWIKVMNLILTLFFLVCLLTLGLLVALVTHLRRGQKLRKEVSRLRNSL